MQNEYGVEMTRNGYAPSIMGTTDGLCYLCENYTHTERHEIFGGSNRTKSKALGLWVCLCPACHRTGAYAVHQNKYVADKLHREGQQEAMCIYDWSVDEFRRRFGKNYL